MKTHPIIMKAAIFFIIMGLVFTAAACGNTAATTASASTGATSGNASATAAKAATKKTSLTFALEQEPATMDPHNMTDGASYSITSNLYDTLVWIEDSGKIMPMLAKEWSISTDGLIYTFKLEKGVDFQNGEHMTAKDVQYTFERAMASKTTTAATSFIASTKVIDDYTFEVTLKYPYAPALTCFGSQFLRVVNKKAVDEAGANFKLNPGKAGTGPYIFESWVSGKSITLVANEKYWRGAPAIKKVDLRFITDETTRTVAVETGEVDIGAVPFLSVKNIEANKKLAHKVIAGQTVNYFGFNTKKAPFDNQLVRQAIAYSFDKEELLLVSRETPAGGVLTASPVKQEGFGFNPDLKLYPKDLDKAKKLLAEAGHPNGFNCKIYVTSQAFRKTIATFMQASMAALGIKAEIVVMEQAALLEDIKAGKTEMFIMGANAFAADADLYLYTMYHTGASVNYTHVSDPQLDKKLDEARAATDTAKRAALYKEITQYIYDKVYDIPNFWITSVFAYNKDLAVDVIPVASRYYFYGMRWLA